MPSGADDDSSGSLLYSEVAREIEETQAREHQRRIMISSTAYESPLKSPVSDLHCSLETMNTAATTITEASIHSFLSSSGENYYDSEMPQQNNIPRDIGHSRNSTEDYVHHQARASCSEDARMQTPQDQLSREAEQACLDEGVIPQLPSLPPELIKPAPGGGQGRSSITRDVSLSSLQRPPENRRPNPIENHADFPTEPCQVEHVARRPASPPELLETNRSEEKLTPAQRAAIRYNEQMARQLAEFEVVSELENQPMDDESDKKPAAIAHSPYSNNNQAEEQQQHQQPATNNNDLMDISDDDKKPAAVVQSPSQQQPGQVSAMRSSLATPRKTKSLSPQRMRVSFKSIPVDNNANRRRAFKVHNLDHPFEGEGEENREEPSEQTSTLPIPIPRGRGLRGRRNQDDREARRQRILDRAVSADNDGTNTNATHGTHGTHARASARTVASLPPEPGQHTIPHVAPVAPGDSLSADNDGTNTNATHGTHGTHARASARTVASLPPEPGQHTIPHVAPVAPGDSLASSPQPVASRAVPRTVIPPNEKGPNAAPEAYETDNTSSHRNLSEKERLRREDKAAPSSIRPGAYKQLPGRGLVRNDTLRFSLMNNIRSKGQSLRRMFSSRRGLSSSDRATSSRGVSGAARESLDNNDEQQRSSEHSNHHQLRPSQRRFRMTHIFSSKSMLGSIPSVLVEDDDDKHSYVGNLSFRSQSNAEAAGALTVARPVFTKDPSLAVCTRSNSLPVAEGEMIASAEPVLLSQEEEDNTAKERAKRWTTPHIPKPHKLFNRIIRPPKMNLKGGPVLSSVMNLKGVGPSLPSVFRRKKTPKRAKSTGTTRGAHKQRDEPVRLPESSTTTSSVTRRRYSF